MEKPLHWYRLFGCNLGSEVALGSHLGVGRPPADAVFTFGPPEVALPDDALCLYRSTPPTAGGEPAFRFFRTPDREILRCTGLVDFHLFADRIVAHPATAEPGPLIEIHLLGSVLSYWLEKRGLATLHASAVAVGARAAAFASRHGGGKSGLAAAFLQAGHALLSDDLLAVEERQGRFLGRPGYPQMRMWPDEAAHFLGGYEHLPFVHPELTKRRVSIGPGFFGAFHDAPAPLAALYLLERLPPQEALEIREIPPRDALIELLRQTFSPRLVAAAGLQPARFDLLSHLVLHVPVKRLRYPSGFALLPKVVESIHNDLDRC